MRASRHVSSVLMLLLLPAVAGAGSVRGMLWVARPRPVSPAAEAAAATHVTARQQRGVTDAIVWIERVPPDVERRLARGGRHWFWSRSAPRVPCMVQRGNIFVPRVLAIAAGGSVEFRNLDGVYHSVFSVSAAHGFDTGKYAPGRADTVTFPHPGVVNVHCDIHPSETGFIVVAPNHAWARPDSLGRFKFDRLPAGRFTFHAWHPRLGETTRTVEVPRRGATSVQLGL